MQGQRKMVTVHVYDGFVGTNGGFKRSAVPVAKIVRLEQLERGNAGAGPISEASTKLYDGRESYFYVRETLDEIVQQIETRVE